MEEQFDDKTAPVKIGVETQTFVCENCGGVMKYDIGIQKFRCSACKTEVVVETEAKFVSEYDFNQYHEKEKMSVAFEGIAIVHCQNCGCEITFDDFQIATTCPMCSSSQVATVKQTGGIPPEGIVPFKVDKTTAGEKFKQWAKSRWFAPNDFKKKSEAGALEGMYLPFWTFDTDAVSDYVGKGGNHRTVTDNEGNKKTVTDWYHTSGTVSRSFDDIQVCATTRGDDIKGILPFNTVESTIPFSASYLSGFHAELYSIKADACFEAAKVDIDNELRTLAEQDIRRSYDEARVERLSTRHYNVTYKHLLLPVWSSVFNYKGYIYKYFVNGETGTVDGERPYSALKIIAAIAVGVLIVAGIIILNQN